MTTIRYVGIHDEVEIAATGDVVAHGATVDVDPELAGHPPVGTPGEDGYDPGSGLLAQDDTWVAVKHAKAPKAAASDDAAGITTEEQ